MNKTVKRMSSEYYSHAPDIVKKNIAAIFKNESSATGTPYEIVLVDKIKTSRGYMAIGLDIGNGLRGEHFEMEDHEVRSYRRKMAKNRVKWVELPGGVAQTIVSYLQEWNM